MMNEGNPILLTSPAPLDDGGRRYNGIYAASIAILAVLCAASDGSFEAAVLGALIGAFLGYVIKACIVEAKWYKLRDIKFAMPAPVPKEMLISRLTETLTPMGMMVEASMEGTPVITYQNVIYDVSLQEDQTFIIWWRKSLVRAFISIHVFTVILNYRKAVVAMGIIGYQIQKICEECLQGEPGDRSVQVQTESMGVKGKPVKKWPIIAAGIIAVLILIAALSGSDQYVEMIRGGHYGDDWSVTVGEAFDRRFSDGEWSEAEDTSYKGLMHVYFEGVDTATGTNWRVVFNVKEEDPEFEVNSIFIDNTPFFDATEIYYLMNYIYTGNLNQLWNDLGAALGAAFLGALFGAY